MASEYCGGSKEREIHVGFLEELEESPRKIFKNYQSPGLTPELMNQNLRGLTLGFGKLEKLPRWDS